MDLNKTGLFISAMRKQKDMTQKELAEIIGITDKAVSRWETGKGFPDVSLLSSLAEALDVSISEIIMGEKIKIEEKGAIDIMDKTIKDTLAYTQREIVKSKRWKNVAISIFIIIFSVAIVSLSELAINMGSSWMVIPAHIIFFVWLAVALGMFIMRKNKILTLLLCGFSIFVAIFFYSSMNEVPTRDFSNFDGFTMTYLPQYTVVLILFIISVALGVGTILAKSKSLWDKILFPLTATGITTILLLGMTIQSIVAYVDLNGYGVNPKFTILILLAILINCISLALVARKYRRFYLEKKQKVADISEQQ